MLKVLDHRLLGTDREELSLRKCAMISLWLDLALRGSFLGKFHIRHRCPSGWDDGCPFNHPVDNHTACVSFLRWSHKGNYLASDAGDNLVMIWQRTRIGEMENWRSVHALHKHTADVLGLNWSPNDAMLASCSVDNSVIIWDA